MNERGVKLIIAGGREFTNYNMLKDRVDKIISNIEVDLIISGGARGADTLAIEYAKERKLPWHVEEADWTKYGKSAGYIRNEVMAKMATHLVAFWSGVKERSGTYHMIQLAEKYKLKIRVVRYEQ
jgi:hypothetical protein